ncbi:integrase core domain-containing protein [Streptomyces sp. NPDC006294]|uniref:integrase core domain-containing protein n=1 Tax=Streptomyces sp. NPDC006294 TaxID=3364743 RepID=UPI0036A2391F
MESTIGLFKTELIKPRRPWKTLSEVELATAEWIDWYCHRRLHGEIGHIPPADSLSPAPRVSSDLGRSRPCTISMAGPTDNLSPGPKHTCGSPKRWSISHHQPSRLAMPDVVPASSAFEAVGVSRAAAPRCAARLRRLPEPRRQPARLPALRSSRRAGCGTAPRTDRRMSNQSRERPQVWPELASRALPARSGFGSQNKGSVTRITYLTVAQVARYSVLCLLI